MKVTLFKEDMRDSGWFEFLKEIGKIPADVEFENILDASGEVALYKELFENDVSVELDVNSAKL